MTTLKTILSASARGITGTLLLGASLAVIAAVGPAAAADAPAAAKRVVLISAAGTAGAAVKKVDEVTTRQIVVEASAVEEAEATPAIIQVKAEPQVVAIATTPTVVTSEPTEPEVVLVDEPGINDEPGVIDEPVEPEVVVPKKKKRVVIIRKVVPETYAYSDDHAEAPVYKPRRKKHYAASSYEADYGYSSGSYAGYGSSGYGYSSGTDYSCH